MLFTIFDSVTSTKPRTLEGWETLVEVVNEIRIVEDKMSVPLYCAGVFFEGTLRAKENVDYVSMGIGDLDGASEADVMALVEELEEMDLEFVLHTTHSYSGARADGLFKCRLIFPFDKPVPPHEWDRVWHGLNKLCNGLLDKQCKDPSRMYFATSQPKGGDTIIHHYVTEDTTPVPVNLLFDEGGDVVTKEMTFEAPSDEVLERISSSVRAQLAKKLLAAMPAAIEGEGGDLQTFRAACIGRDCALDPEEFWPLLVEYNERCEPVWEEDDLKTKLNSAYGNGSMPVGWRLAGQTRRDTVTAKDLKELTKELLGKKRGADNNALGRTIRSLLAGDPFTGVEMLVEVGNALARKFLHGDPSQIADLFAASLDKSSAQDCSVSTLATAIGEKQTELQARQADARAFAIEDEATMYETAFEAIGVERSTPYTREERNEIANIMGVEGKRARKQWVVRKQKSFYFFLGDRYVGPFTQDEAFNAASTYLAPAKLELQSMGQNGPRNLSPTEIVETYGTLAHRVEANMSIQRSYYDPKNKTMYEAVSPMREDIEPIQHEEVEEWLWYLAGEEEAVFDKLMDWLACLPDLTRTCCAIMFYGAKGTGKSLFADACARLWGRLPTELKDLAGNFNSKIANCPVVKADEGTVRDHRGRPDTQLLRRIITEYSRTLRRKNIADSDLVGCLRLIVSANDLHDNLANEHTHLTNDAIAALCERFLVVHVKNDAAATYLSELSEEASEGIKFGTWVAEQALWLRENREVEYGNRLLVEGFQDSELALHLTTGSGLRSEICNFTASYVTDLGKKLKTNAVGEIPRVATMPDGTKKLLVTSSMLYNNWTTYCENRPTKGAIEKALGGLSERCSHQDEKYRAVEMKYIEHWAVNNGHCSRDEFRSALGKLGLLVEDDDGECDDGQP